MRGSISFKISLIIVLAFVVMTAAVMGIVAKSSLDFARSQATQAQASSMRVAWDVIGERGKPFRLEGDQLLVGDRVLNGDPEAVDHVKALVGGTATVFMGDKRVTTNVTKPDGSRAVGTALAKGQVYDTVLGKGLPYRGEAKILGKPFFVAYDPIKDAGGRVIGIMYVGVPQETFFKPVYHQLTILGLACAFLGAVGATASVLMIRRQLSPLATLRDAMGRVMGGDLSVSLAFAGRQGDIGLMADAVHRFRDDALEKDQIAAQAAEQREATDAERQAAAAENARRTADQDRVLNSLAEHLNRLSGGDLTTRLSEPFAAEYEGLRTDFNRAVEGLETAMSGIVSAVAGLDAEAGGIAAAADDLSRRSEQQAASLEETAAALDQITVTVRRTADGTRDAHRAMDEAQTAAGRSREIVASAVEAIGGIESSSRQVGQIIGVIDEIAFQTNLLALNAGVEAARAGDAGRGFAVVASEVRALAQRSAEAAKEIKSLVGASSSQVEQGVSLVGQTGEALQQIIARIDTISGVVSEIAASAQEQSASLGQVNSAVNQMDQSTQQTAAMVEESTAASQALAAGSAQLSSLVGQFRISGERSPEVRAAPEPAARPRPQTRTINRSAGSGGAVPRFAAEAADEWAEF
jgi:methyl-accepting chemotaxis protein